MSQKYVLLDTKHIKALKIIIRAAYKHLQNRYRNKTSFPKIFYVLHTSHRDKVYMLGPFPRKYAIKVAMYLHLRKRFVVIVPFKFHALLIKSRLYSIFLKSKKMGPCGSKPAGSPPKKLKKVVYDVRSKLSQ